MEAAICKIISVQSCKGWLATLPLANAQFAHNALSTQIKLLNAATVPADVRLQVMETLRQPVASVQAELAKRFVNQLVPLEAPVMAVWNEVNGLWQAMIQGYSACINTGSAELALTYHRVLDYIGLAMFDHNKVYRAISPDLWKQFHDLFEAVELSGVAAAAVSDPVNRDNPSSCCLTVYLQTLLMQHATPDALTFVQITAIQRWLNQWFSLVKFTKTANPADGIARLAVIYGTNTGARDCKDVQPAPNVRYLEVGALGAMLTQMVAGLRNGKTPVELALGSGLPQPACEKLLALLNTQWCGADGGRSEDRNPSSLKVMVSMSIAAMHFHLTGRAFRQPGAPMSRREQDDMQMFGHVSDRTEKALLSQRSGALETWEILNHSKSGILGMCRQPDAATRICHNQLLGLRTATGRTFYLGVVQRLQIDEAGSVSIGLRVIPGTPQPIAARVRDPAVVDSNRFDRALLMPADEARKAPASLIMAPNCFQPNRDAELYVSAQQTVKLTELLDKGVNFERAKFADS